MERDASAPGSREYHGSHFTHTSFLHDAPVHARPRLSTNMFSYLSVGQILRMVRVSNEILPRFRACCQRQAL